MEYILHQTQKTDLINVMDPNKGVLWL